MDLRLQIQKQNNCVFDGAHQISPNDISFNKKQAVLIKDNSKKAKINMRREDPFMLS